MTSRYLSKVIGNYRHVDLILAHNEDLINFFLIAQKFTSLLTFNFIDVLFFEVSHEVVFKKSIDVVTETRVAFEEPAVNG